MQPLDIPERKWDIISLDFTTRFMNIPRGFDVIWVIMDRLSKSVHFIPIKISFSLQKLEDRMRESYPDLFSPDNFRG